MHSEFAEILDKSEKIGGTNKSLIEVVSPLEASNYEPDENDFLVGRGLIMRGQVFCIGRWQVASGYNAGAGRRGHV